MFDIVEKHRGFFKILLVLIALSFVTFTAHSFSEAGGDYITKIGDNTVTDNDVRRMIQMNELNPDAQTRDQVYQYLVQQAYLIGGAQKMGVSSSQEQIKQNIMAQAAFQENGTFSQAKFNEYLQRSGQSEAMLVEGLKREHYTRSVLELLGSGSMIADAQAENLIKVYSAQREVQTLSFAPAQYAAKVSSDDAKIEAFYQENQKRYIQPQAVKFAYVKVGAADLAAAQIVSEEELQAALSGNAAADTAAVRAQLQLEKAVRALPVLKENMAEAAFNENMDLNGVAKTAQAQVQQHDTWLSREDAEKAGIPAAVSAALFSDDVLVQRNNSDAIEADGAIWVVRVSDVRAEKAQALSEIKEQVKQEYITAEARALAQAAATDALGKLQQGEKVELAWTPVENVNLTQAQTVLPPSDFQQFMQATPQENQPAYLLSKELPEPTLMRINTIHTPPVNADLLAQTKPGLMQKNGQDNLQDYLRYLQRTIKSDAGRQKVNDE
ncbi:MAG: SurA N-terminal domain-containing protein [Neisseria sp.]|nr:SurA N-terminal domain-containing protein [Neisseria sp.]